MTTPLALPIEQHNIEIQRNRAVWSRKPILRKVYGQFFRLIASRIDPDLQGPVVELGSGMGRIKETIPQCITMDIFPNPAIDRQENVYRLGFPDGSVSHLILFDVWHHLRYPGTALREFHRELVSGGRLILFEPAASWVGRIVYDWFHHERASLVDPISWDAPSGFSSGDIDYYTSQGSATRLFWWGEFRNRFAGWRTHEVQPIVSFAYLSSDGFSGPQFSGRFLYGLMKGLDRVASLAPRIFAVRLLVVL